MPDSYNYHNEYFSSFALDRDEDLAPKVSKRRSSVALRPIPRPDVTTGRYHEP